MNWLKNLIIAQMFLFLSFVACTSPKGPSVVEGQRLFNVEQPTPVPDSVKNHIMYVEANRQYISIYRVCLDEKRYFLTVSLGDNGRATTTLVPGLHVNGAGGSIKCDDAWGKP